MDAIREISNPKQAMWLIAVLLMMCGMSLPLPAQNFFNRFDSLLTAKYRKGTVDTAYIKRPETKWTIKARINVSGAKIEAEGIDNEQHFKSAMEANRKTTVSLGMSYLGISLGMALNPAKLTGKYSDFELNFNSYGRHLGFDVIYQNAKNFTGWHDHDGMERIELPDDMLKVKTLNLNAYYVFNNKHFSYPAAFSQSYIQRHSAGSFLAGTSGMWQHATLDWKQAMHLKMTNVGLGVGYGYNYIPAEGLLLHISALPTFIVFSKVTMTFGDDKVNLRYHFPEAIIMGRGAIVKHWHKTFMGITMVYNFTNIGEEERLAVHNTKWCVRTLFGLRI